MFAQLATRAQREWPGPQALEAPRLQLVAATGFIAYCGSFEVHDGQVMHQREFGVFRYMSDTRVRVSLPVAEVTRQLFAEFIMGDSTDIVI
jgi:hypothetical protein